MFKSLSGFCYNFSFPCINSCGLAMLCWETSLTTGSRAAQHFPFQNTFRLHFHTSPRVQLVLGFEAPIWEGGSCWTDRKSRKSAGFCEKAKCVRAKPQVGTQSALLSISFSERCRKKSDTWPYAVQAYTWVQINSEQFQNQGAELVPCSWASWEKQVCQHSEMAFLPWLQLFYLLHTSYSLG